MKAPGCQDDAVTPAKILVVDDEPDVVELIRFHLEAQGHQVITASNGFDAITQARRHAPDLVILDVMMEGVDGLSVCEILRAQPATRGTPVIIVTAAVGEMARLNSYAAGATDFVTKPFSPQELVRKAGRILEATVRRNKPVTP
jgi:CheY-like chemotaxis protein